MPNFKVYRQALGLSQRQMGEALGITGQAYGNYETGKREADYATLRALAGLFGVTVDELLRAPDGDESGDDARFAALLEQYRTRPGMRTLFSAAASATEEDLAKATEIIEIMKRSSTPDE